MDSTVRQLHAFFNPDSVAVVGATKKIMKAGHVIFKNFEENKRRGVFKGKVYAVNPNEESILGIQSFPSLRAIPDEVELAVIVVPASAVLNVMDDAAAKGVKDVVIVSSGFGEIGNSELEGQVAAVGRKAGIMLFPCETFFLGRGDDLAVLDQRSR